MDVVVDLELLVSSLQDRALGVGRSVKHGAQELGNFVEDVNNTLEKLNLVPPRKRPVEWHSEIAKRVEPSLASRFHANSFSDMDIAYGKRNKAGHPNYDWATTHENIKARIGLVAAEARELVCSLPHVCDALLHYQRSDAHQRLASELLVDLGSTTSGSSDDAGRERASRLAETLTLMASAVLGPAITTQLRSEAAPDRLVRRVVRHVAAKQATSRGHQLIKLVRGLADRATELELPREPLDTWLRRASGELGGTGDPSIGSPLSIVRVRLEWEPAGGVAVQDVSLTDGARVPDDLMRKALPEGCRPPAEVEGAILDMLKRLKKLTGWDRLRWSSHILQLELPTFATYLPTPELDVAFRAVTVCPRVAFRDPVPLGAPFVTRPGCGLASLAEERRMTANELHLLLGERQALCLFAAPELVDPRKPEDRQGGDCPAVSAFREHPLAVHFHGPGLDRQLEELFGPEEQLPMDQVLLRTQTQRRQHPRRVTVLWDDPAYDHRPEAMA